MCVNFDNFDVAIPDLIPEMMSFDGDIFSALLGAFTMGQYNA
jgi:hypothetical protein